MQARWQSDDVSRDQTQHEARMAHLNEFEKYKQHEDDDRHGPGDDLRNWLPDSGATAHFTPVREDLSEIRPCDISITVADGQVIYATEVGIVCINLWSDQGERLELTLRDVYFVPGLDRRLFSIPAFTDNPRFLVHISRRFTQLDFDSTSATTEGSTTYTWPVLRHGPNEMAQAAGLPM
jgi:hypothetical protein